MLTATPERAALGATVTGIDLREPLTRDLVDEVRALLLRHQVLFFPSAGLSPVEQIRLGQSFGALQCHASLDALVAHPEVVLFDTAVRAQTAEWWHSDVTCAPEPPMGSILQIVIAPPRGGATHWASMTAAYDARDDEVKTRIETLEALHRSWWQPVQESLHPVVRTHPDTGRKAMFVNGLFTKHIVGMNEAESNELLRYLFAHATRDEFTVHHDWRSGDIAFLDNRCTQHRVDNDFGPAQRRGHRVAIDGDAPYLQRAGVA